MTTSNLTIGAYQPVDTVGAWQTEPSSALSLTLDAGSYSLTGSDITFSIPVKITLVSGNYSLLGSNLVFGVSYVSGWKGNRNLGPWEFTKLADKPHYNEGTSISSPEDPVWKLDTSGEQVTEGHNPWCGYWHKDYTPPIVIPISDNFAIATKLFITSSQSDMSAIVFDKTDLVWAKAYHAGASSRFAYSSSIIEVSDDLIMVGQISIGIYQHAAVLKVNKDTGSVIWSTVFDQGLSDEYFSDIQETSDGGLICTGRFRRGAANYDLVVIKLTSTGNISWAKIFDSTHDDYGRRIIELSSGDLILCGFTLSLAESNYSDALIMKLNSSGIVLWSKRYNKTGTNDTETLYDIQETSDGGFISIGEVNETGASFQNDILIIKTTSDGSISWSIRITVNDSFGNRSGYKIREVSGGYVLIGYHSNSLALTKINTSGAWLWSKRLQNEELNYIWYGDTGGLTITDDGIAFAGGVYNSVIGAYDTVVSHVNFDGVVSGCSYFSSFTPTLEAGNISVNTITITLTTLIIGLESHTITEVDHSLTLNNYCSSEPDFVHQITNSLNENLEVYDIIKL